MSSCQGGVGGLDPRSHSAVGTVEKEKAPVTGGNLDDALENWRDKVSSSRSVVDEYEPPHGDLDLT